MSDCRGDHFRARLLEWGRRNCRKFPWRETVDAYAILISELMLRRTRSDQVAPVFVRFIDRFPDPAQLAAAEETEVQEILRPLGLWWRLPAFQAVARSLVEMEGDVPSELAKLTKLPGVGDYVASAVRAFAFNLPATLVDTNTVRVAARYFGFDYHAESRRNARVRAEVARLMDSQHPRDSAQALLDFASTVCRARAPLCPSCPVRETCVYGQSGVNVAEVSVA